MTPRQEAKEGSTLTLETSKGSASSELTKSWLQVVDPCHSLSIHSHTHEFTL